MEGRNKKTQPLAPAHKADKDFWEQHKVLLIRLSFWLRAWCLVTRLGLGVVAAGVIPGLCMPRPLLPFRVVVVALAPKIIFYMRVALGEG